jgi:hypothetical protein
MGPAIRLNSGSDVPYAVSVGFRQAPLFKTFEVLCLENVNLKKEPLFFGVKVIGLF